MTTGRKRRAKKANCVNFATEETSFIFLMELKNFFSITAFFECYDFFFANSIVQRYY